MVKSSQPEGNVGSLDGDDRLRTVSQLSVYPPVSLPVHLHVCAGSLPDILQEAKVPLVDRVSCQRALAEYSITSSMLCAGFPEGGVDSCQVISIHPLGSDVRKGG